MVNIALIDNQQIFREGLIQLLEAEGNYQVIFTADELQSLETDIIEEIDLFLVDLSELLKEQTFVMENLLYPHSNKKIIALSTEREKKKVTEVMLLGIHGYFLKEMSFATFFKSIQIVLEGGVYIHPYATKYIVHDFQRLVKNKPNFKESMEEEKVPSICTKRELEILQLLTDGENNQGIANRLNISEKTVKNHLTNIFRKIDVKDRTQAVVLSIRNNWVEL